MLKVDSLQFHQYLDSKGTSNTIFLKYQSPPDYGHEREGNGDRYIR